MSKRRAEHPEHEQPAEQSELGRAIARSREVRNSRGARGFDLPDAQIAPTRRQTLQAYLAMTIGLIGFGVFLCSEGGPRYVTLLGLAIMVLGLVVFLSNRNLYPLKGGAVVGVDGVLVRGQFIPYSRISKICHEIRQRRSGGGYDGESWGPTDGWIVLLRLVGGKEIDLGTEWVSAESDDVRGADLAQAIEAARAAWVDARLAPGEEEEMAVVTRSARTGRAWLYALRGLGSGVRAPYRGVPIDVAHLSTVLDNSRAKPSVRAAAAISLTAAGDATAAKRLRIAAESMANPQLRVALENVAGASDDTAVAEALEMLDKIDREEDA